MDDKLKDYIHEGDLEKKKLQSEELLNESAAEFLEERKMDNLLSLSFQGIDVSAKALETIKDSEEELPDLADNVLRTIGENKRKKNIIYFISGLAAVLALSIVLINLNTGIMQFSAQKEDSQEKPEYQNKKYKEIIELSEGVTIRIVEDSTYELIDSQDEFLRLKKGHVLIEVKSRKDKPPLFFKMPHSTVKVTGTAFTLKCDSESSYVNVHEGAVELIKKGRVIKLSANQFDSSNRNFMDSGDVLSGLENQYSFEKISGLNIEGSPKLVEGVRGSAIKFAGASKVIIPRSTKVRQESISFWFKVDEFYNEPQSIIGQNNSNNSVLGFNIVISKGGFLVLQLKDRSKMNKSNKTPIAKGKWHHVAFTRSLDGDFAFYLDGNQILSDNFRYWYAREDIYLGKSLAPYWKYFRGAVDELRIYNRPLSSKEVRKIYNKK